MDSITMVGGCMLEAGNTGGIQQQQEGPCGYYVLRALRVQRLSGLRGM